MNLSDLHNRFVYIWNEIGQVVVSRTWSPHDKNKTLQKQTYTVKTTFLAQWTSKCIFSVEKSSLIYVRLLYFLYSLHRSKDGLDKSNEFGVLRTAAEYFRTKNLKIGNGFII